MPAVLPLALSDSSPRRAWLIETKLGAELPLIVLAGAVYTMLQRHAAASETKAPNSASSIGSPARSPLMRRFPEPTTMSEYEGWREQGWRRAREAGRRARHPAAFEGQSNAVAFCLLFACVLHALCSENTVF